MKILIVASSWMEVRLITDELKLVQKESDIQGRYLLGGKELDVLITGIGTTFTTFHLTRTLMIANYDMVLCVGIAGSFSTDLKIGEVVNVVSEEFADLGIENNGGFLTLFESGFIHENQPPFVNGRLTASVDGSLTRFKNVHGITANLSHRKTSSIAALNNKFSAQIESAEGAAVFYVCNQFNIPCYQIRAISNYLEPNNFMKWNIPLALENLKKSVMQTVSKLPLEVA